MGRIKTRLIKAISRELMDNHREEFTKKYEDNKGKVMELAEVKSKKLRNIIAGYVTRMVKADAN